MTERQTLHIDFETRSTIELKDVGAYVYASHPTTDVWCMAYAFDDEPVQLWLPGQPIPSDVHAFLVTEKTVAAHNAAFERVIFRYIMGPRYGWPVPPTAQWRCTMAMAYAMTLPGSLEEAAAAVGLTARKDMTGRRLMLQMAKPRRKEVCSVCKGMGYTFRTTHPDDRGVECLVCEGAGATYAWWNDTDRLQRLYAYCKQDIEVERLLEKRLMQLRPQERKIWLLDQEVNDRGVYIDKKLCDQALIVVEKTQKALDAEMKSVTKGAVGSCANVSDLKKWLNANGVPAESLNKESTGEMLAGWPLPPECRRAIELRQEAAKTSTAKIKKMLMMRSPEDGRMRGNLQYHRGGTFRWAARGAQLQNLPRPALKKDVPAAIETIIETASPGLISVLYGPPLSVVSDCIRGMIAAPKGHDILSADFSAIEARVVAWLAGQRNIVEMFARDEDVYCYQAGTIYQRKITKADDSERQVGKVSVLSLGYQGGANAFAKMAGNYGIQLEPIFDTIWDSATDKNRELAADGYAQRGGTSKLSKKAWLTGECIKLAWRDANPNIVQYWRDLEDAAIAAVCNPGQQFDVQNVAYRVSGSFLWCRLPSGRVLCYPYPRIKDVDVPWGKKRSIVYKTVDGLTRKWGDKVFYGGLACENITQAVARDLMAEAMLRVNAAGYKVIITIHDEVVAEVPVDFGSLEEFISIMEEVPAWAKGCPVAASGWRDTRYRK